MKINPQNILLKGAYDTHLPVLADLQKKKVGNKTVVDLSFQTRLSKESFLFKDFTNPKYVLHGLELSLLAEDALTIVSDATCSSFSSLTKCFDHTQYPLRHGVKTNVRFHAELRYIHEYFSFVEYALDCYQGANSRFQMNGTAFGPTYIDGETEDFLDESSCVIDTPSNPSPSDNDNNSSQGAIAEEDDDSEDEDDFPEESSLFFSKKSSAIDVVVVSESLPSFLKSKYTSSALFVNIGLHYHILQVLNDECGFITKGESVPVYSFTVSDGLLQPFEETISALSLSEFRNTQEGNLYQVLADIQQPSVGFSALVEYIIAVRKDDF